MRALIIAMSSVGAVILSMVPAFAQGQVIIHRNNRQDPTAAPGTFYEVFTFDTFRVRNGKLIEHWDGAVINPPATGGRQ